jgi:hypothetical protein
VLFTAVTGRLTERAKALARRVRAAQVRTGRPADGAGDEWVTREFDFTIRALERPNAEQKAILEAIGRSARMQDSQPGAPMRATGLSRTELEPGSVDFAPAYLPRLTQEDAENELWNSSGPLE